MRTKLTYGLLLLLFAGCEKWYTTEEVSHISELPRFALEGGDFVSFVRSDSGEYSDPGATAFSGDQELIVYAVGEVDLTRVGVYVIRYYAQNPDKLVEMAERIIAVTHEEISSNDLSGTYEGTNWEPVESKVKIIHPLGLYECEEVMGYYDFEMPGRFVDLGNNELVLINGEGYLGRYAATIGQYTLSTLSWTISLVDPPNDGVEIDVLWRKQD